MYLYSRIMLKRLSPAFVIITGVVFLLFFSIPMAFMFIACLGAYTSVALPLAAFLRNRMNND